MITLKNVSFTYSEQKEPALRDINLNIRKGEFTAILGHNGSGKSTLAKLLNGILLPTEGEVTVMGMDTKKEEEAIRRKVGMVFQNPDNQIVATIVEEDVAFGPENLGVEPSCIRKRVDDALRAVNMYAFRKHAPYFLSGGQKQRIAIAGVIAMLPDCIVLDEPTAMLDPEGRREVMETIKRLNRELGITIILITHFMQEAALSDRVIVMENGKILHDGTPQEILTRRDDMHAAKLDTPQVTELMYQLSAAGFCVPTDIIDTEACVTALCTALGKEAK